MSRSRSGLFVAEGSSDAPLADVVELLFLGYDHPVNLSSPDFSALRVAKDVGSRVSAGLDLTGSDVDVIVVRRDADNAGLAARRTEMENALQQIKTAGRLVPVIPARMTELRLGSFLMSRRSVRLRETPMGDQIYRFRNQMRSSELPIRSRC